MLRPEHDYPQGFVAAFSHFVGTILLLFAAGLEFIVVVILRVNRSVSGDDPPPAKSTRKASRIVARAPALIDVAVEPPTTRRRAVRTVVPREAIDEAPTQVSVPQRSEIAHTLPSADEVKPARSRAPTTLTADDSTRVGATGKVIAAGLKEHMKSGRTYQCFTVTLQTSLGEISMFQGKELEGALHSANAGQGDRVTLLCEGKSFVGSFGGRKCFRNNWTVTKH